MVKLLNWITAERIGAFATVIAVIVAGFALYIAQNQLVSNQRAWLAPQGLVFEKHINSEEPIIKRDRRTVVLLKIENVGNEPARNVVHNIAINTITPQQYVDTAYLERIFVKIMGGAKCSAIKPNQSGMTIFSGTQNSRALRIPIPATNVNEIIDGKEFLVVMGCFAYISSNNVRRTGFCRFFDPTDKGPPGTWKTSVCVGDYAD